MSCNIGCDALSAHEELECNERLYGVVTAIGLLSCSNTSITDFSNASQLNAAIAANELHLIKGIIGEKPVGSPEMIDPLSGLGLNQEFASFTEVVNFTDPNISNDNFLFYQDLLTREYHPILYLGREGQTLIYRTPARLIAPFSLPKDKNQPARFEAQLMWTTRVNPLLTEAPASVWA
jgi:hypothetical protein